MHFVRAAALVGALGLTFAAGGCGGSGGATPAVPQQGIGASGALSSTTATEDSTITGSLKTIELYGPIVALKSGGFQMHAQPGIGYVDVFPISSTQKFYNGLTPAVNEYAIVTATGSVSTSPSPVLIALYKTQPTSVTVTGTVTSEQPYGVAIKLDSNGAYIPLAFNTLTNLYGFIGTGVHVSASGTGTSAVLFPSSVTDTSMTSTSTAAVPKHVLTADVFWGYGGTPTTVAVSSAAPYLSWAQTAPAYITTLHGAGIKVDAYVNFWRNYTSDPTLTLYDDIAPGGAHYPAAARTCTGTVIQDPAYGGGYEADARSSYALGHAQIAALLDGTDALFSDDTGTVNDLPLPCNFSLSAYQTAVNTLDGALKIPMFVNTLGAGSSPIDQVGYTSSSNVLGAMCEMCITKNPSTGDVPVLNNGWIDTENAEIKMISLHKIFWLYARASGPATEYQLRNYTIASFLLAYGDPNYAMLQEAFQTNSKFPIMPETGLVPTNPLTTSSTVAGYAMTGGTYMREFGACYYRGTLVGRCAVVVNPTSSSATIPTTAYGHAMVLSGSGVLDGGTVSFAGTRPSSLPSGSGVVLFP